MAARPWRRRPAACSLLGDGHGSGSPGSLPALDSSSPEPGPFPGEASSGSVASDPISPVPRMGREHRGTGLLKQPGPRGQLRASPAPPHLRSHNYKRGRVSPWILPRAQSQHRRVLPVVLKPSGENSQELSEPAWSLQPLVTRLGLDEGWGTEKQEGSLRGRGSADAALGLPPSQPHSDARDTRCGWQSARVPAGRPPPSGVPGAQDGRQRMAPCPRAVTAAGVAPEGGLPRWWPVGRAAPPPPPPPSLSWHQGTDPGFCHTFPSAHAGPLWLSPRRPRARSPSARPVRHSLSTTEVPSQAPRCLTAYTR